MTGCCPWRGAATIAASTYAAEDAGDGPAVLVVLFLGAIVTGLAAIVEFKF